MSNIVIDDTNSTLTYSGQWTLLAGGSSRQWNSTVHSTFQTGATVSFQFQGSVCKVYGTVPIGNGSTVLMDVTIDGSVSPIVSQTSGSAPIYADLFYQSSSMQSTWHTVVITNQGGVGNLDFEFDRVELDANDIVPTIAAWSPASTSSTSTISPSVLTEIVTTTMSDGSAVTSTSEITFFPSATSRASSGSAHTIPVRTVIGIVAGIIALVILLLLLFLCHRRRKTKNHRFSLVVSSDNAAQDMSQNPTTVATPFTRGPSSSPANLNAFTDSPSQLPFFSAMSEKALRQQTANRPEIGLEAVSTPSPIPFSSSNTLSLDLIPLGESLISSPPATPRGPPESNQTPAHAVRASDVPPAYQPNE